MSSSDVVDMTYYVISNIRTWIPDSANLGTLIRNLRRCKPCAPSCLLNTTPTLLTMVVTSVRVSHSGLPVSWPMTLASASLFCSSNCANLRAMGIVVAGQEESV